MSNTTISLSSPGNGHPTPPETARRLTAGPLSVDFLEGELRYFRAGPDEALRRIYAAVRDGSWNTIAAKRTAPVIEQTPGGFTIFWQNEHREGDVDFVWDSNIKGTSDGVIRWEFDGVARQAFAKNRVGFCLLHPLATCQGKPCEVEHVSGDIADRTFPDLIDPMQPVRGLHDFRRMRYAVNEAWDVSLELEGDAFEMEDQRNWSDASFKTYSTPQRIPLPAKLHKGQRVKQVVTVRLIAKDHGPLVAAQRAADIISMTLAGTDGVALPKIGLGLPSHGFAMSEREIVRLRALKLDHVRIDVKTILPDWAETLHNAAAEAARIGCGLEIALHLHDPAIAVKVANEVSGIPCPVARWLILEEGKPVAGPAVLSAAREALGNNLGAGTDIDFFPLNNNRPAVAAADFIFCSIRPQAHAFDDASIIENLDGQTHLVHSAQQIFAPLPFVASPVTLKRRWHKGPPRPAHELPPMVDCRQMSLLGAGWLTGSLRALAEAGAASVTWFETTGWRGVMEVEPGAPLPDQFPSVPGTVFPMYHVLRAAADFQGGSHGIGLLWPVALSQPLAVQAAVLESGPRQRWIIANVTGAPQSVSLPVSGTLRLLDSAAAAAAGTDPESFWSIPNAPVAEGALVLPAWSLAFIDVG